MTGGEDRDRVERDGALPIDPDRGGRRESTARTVRQRRRAERTLVVTIGLAGAAGSLCRYGVATVVTSAASGFPWSTFWVNVVGCALIGFVLVLLLERFPGARLARPLIATGFLGGFTTFSTYMVDAVLLVRNHNVATAILYVIASVAVGIGAVAGGIVLARVTIRIEHRLNEQLG